MSRFNFRQLFARYPAIIGQMPDKFNSHEFILLLAQKNQAGYIEALHEYSRDTDPFQVVHGILSKQLHEYSNLVQYEGETNSTDIFGHGNRCASWSRINREVRPR